ncbi:MAG: hypothetical protein IIA01_03880, partial [Proteobacteria bacterium]|nr:hypothetical protein [Pseudomonadota bacterium]
MTGILDPDRFRFDRSSYERPNFPYRCGRGAAWGKPCANGPNIDGTCGGATACAPFRNPNGRYECRRPATAGGPCADGPKPDGSCSQTMPPCAPRRTLRGVRRRLAILAFGLVVALIAGFSGQSADQFGGLSSSNPGPLTAGHASFIAPGDCASCHAPHGSGSTDWIAAAFTASDNTANCTNCHTFGGPARAAHNAVVPEGSNLGDVSCQMCHTEHKGALADIVEINDVQCATCHKRKFTSFSSGHPAFSDRFPYFRRTAIRFDHASHFAKHFADQRFAERAPPTCVACHGENPNQRSLVRAGFESTCAACHGDQMAQRELVLLRLPEFPEAGIDRESVLEACGPMLDEIGAIIAPMETIEARREPGLGRELGAGALSALAGLLPVDPRRAAQRNRSPSLVRAVARYRAG